MEGKMHRIERESNPLLAHVIRPVLKYDGTLSIHAEILARPTQGLLAEYSVISPWDTSTAPRAIPIPNGLFILLKSWYIFGNFGK